MSSDAPGRDSIVVEEERLRETSTRVPKTILRCPDVSPGATRASMALRSSAHEQERCFPGQDRLGVDNEAARTNLPHCGGQPRGRRRRAAPGHRRVAR
jgi:hypothetical protein